MNPLRKLAALCRRQSLEAELAEELRAHVEMQAAEFERQGMHPVAARLAAQRALGGLEQVKERCRDERRRGVMWLEQSLQDFKYALRTLAKAPGFTAIVVLTIGLGIGLNTLAFSFYDAVAMKGLPVRDPDRVLRISAAAPAVQRPFSFEEYETLRGGLTSVDAVVASSATQLATMANAAGGAAADVVTIVLVSDNYFSGLGVRPVLGRTFGPRDTAAAILGYDAWQRRFNGDADVVGRDVVLQGVPVTIVGIAPRGFGGTALPPVAPDFWLPASAQPLVLTNVDWLREPTVRVWELLARRKGNSSASQVEAEIAVFVARSSPPGEPAVHPRAARARSFELQGPEVHAVGLTLMLAVGLILLVGCVNVLNLVSARNTAREHELAVRLALGAGRGRLLRQLCVESLVLGFAGGAAGLVFASWAGELLRVWVMHTLRQISGTLGLALDLSLDARVFAYTTVLALLTGLLVGLWPALHASRLDVERMLKRDASGAAMRGSWSRRNLLLMVQVAACLVLLAGAGLLFRGAAHALTTDPGFDAQRVFLVMPNVRTIAGTPQGRSARLREIAAELRRLPEVQCVSAADRPPYLGHSIGPYITDEGKWLPGCVTLHGGPEYFETLGLRIVAGRPFTAGEADASAPVALISESAARRFWPGRDALGRTIQLPRPLRAAGDGEATAAFTVIGVVKDARLTLLSRVDDADVFLPRGSDQADLWLVRSRGRAAAAVQSAYAALRRVDATLPSQTVVLTMEDGPMRLQRLLAEAPATFALGLGIIALVLAAVGFYGVVSFVVARRTRELGIRFALGATRPAVIRLVLRQTLRPAAIGGLFGLAGATAIGVLLTRLVLNPELPDLTYGAGAFPVATLALVVTLLAFVVVLAAWIPARRAARIDPVQALRCD